MSPFHVVLMTHFIMVVSRVVFYLNINHASSAHPSPPPVHHYQPLPLPTRHLPASLSITIESFVLCVNPRLVCVNYASVFSYFGRYLVFVRMCSVLFKNIICIKHLYEQNRSSRTHLSPLPPYKLPSMSGSVFRKMYVQFSLLFCQRSLYSSPIVSSCRC